MAQMNKITGIVVGQYGEAIPLTVIDINGAAQDISAYTTSKTVTIRDPFSLKTVSYAATFTTDGTDGGIQFTPAAGDIDRPGEWEGQIKLEKASAIALTRIFTMEVEKRISPSS